MDELTDEAQSLREQLQHYIEFYGLPIEDFEQAGSDGIHQLHEQGIPIEDSTFANKLFDQIECLPIEVVRSMCLAATYLLAGLGAHKKGLPYAINFLIRAAHEIGFVRGMAFGVIDKDSRSARFAAYAKLANDPKQRDKTQVRDCWDAWQKRPDSYKGKAAFARDMREKFPNLESQPVIEGWCRTWERESKPSVC